jgi:four helix bundle protein
LVDFYERVSVKARPFEDVEVWKAAHQWVLAAYKHTQRFPREELLGLTSQLRRASIAVPANIAEGFGKRGKMDKVRFYNIAQGSLNECRYYLILSHDLGFGDSNHLLQEQSRIGRMLHAYAKAVTVAPLPTTNY